MCGLKTVCVHWKLFLVQYFEELNINLVHIEKNKKLTLP